MCISQCGTVYTVTSERQLIRLCQLLGLSTKAIKVTR